MCIRDSYKSNLRDLEFNLFEVFDRSSVLGTGPYEDVDVETAREILREVARLSENELADSFFDADRNPPVFDPATNTVTIPESFKRSYKAYQDAGWGMLSVPGELGGTVVPPSLTVSYTHLDVYKRQDFRREVNSVGTEPPGAGRSMSAIPVMMM